MKGPRYCCTVELFLPKITICRVIWERGFVWQGTSLPGNCLYGPCYKGVIYCGVIWEGVIWKGPSKPGPSVGESFGSIYFDVWDKQNRSHLSCKALSQQGSTKRGSVRTLFCFINLAKNNWFLNNSFSFG